MWRRLGGVKVAFELSPGLGGTYRDNGVTAIKIYQRNRARANQHAMRRQREERKRYTLRALFTARSFILLPLQLHLERFHFERGRCVSFLIS